MKVFKKKFFFSLNESQQSFCPYNPDFAILTDIAYYYYP